MSRIGSTPTISMLSSMKLCSVQMNWPALLRSGLPSPLSIWFATASYVHWPSPPRSSRQAYNHPSGSRIGLSRSSSQPRKWNT